MAAKQTPAGKAITYLTEGRLKVQTHDTTHARILARGSDSRPYTITFDQAGWACDCPAQISDCAHVLAAKMISPLRLSHTPKLGGTAPRNDLDDLLSSGRTAG